MARREAQRGEQIPARRAGFRGWVPAIHGNHRTAVAFRLVFQHRPELGPSGARDRAGQRLVPDHPGHVQVFYGDHVEPLNEIGAGLVQEVAPRVGHPGVSAGDLHPRLGAVAGAFLAAAIVYWNYMPAFHAKDPGLEHTAGVFTTFPAFPEIVSAGFLDQTIGTALLLLMVFAITDERNAPPQANLTPLFIGAIVVAIGMSFGGMHGYAINPARDFGPRLFTAVAGFRNNGLTDGPPVFWVPIAGPILGGLIGSAVYDFGVRRFLPEQKS